MLTAEEVERFTSDGFVCLPGAFPLTPVAPMDLRRSDGAYSPVEVAVLRGLGS